MRRARRMIIGARLVFGVRLDRAFRKQIVKKPRRYPALMLLLHLLLLTLPARRRLVRWSQELAQNLARRRFCRGGMLVKTVTQQMG